MAYPVCYTGAMKLRTKIIATAAAALMALGLGVAPANASNGDFVINAGNRNMILVLDGGTYTYSYPGDTYNFVSYVVIPKHFCIHTPNTTADGNWKLCNYGPDEFYYYDVPNGVHGFALYDMRYEFA